MNNSNETLLLGIIAMLVVIVGVLLWRFLHIQSQICDKDEAIIRGIRENVRLREELQRRLAHLAACAALFVI